MEATTTMPIADRAAGPLYCQIATDLRARIGVQHRPGDMLDSERDLAKQYAVNQRTVRQALDVLAEERLIRRHHGRGTIVLDRTVTGEFAVVVRPQFLRPDASPYYALTSTAIAEAMGVRNSRWATKLHVGRVTERSEDHPDTLDLLEPDVMRRMRGVFSFHSLGALDQALSAARVPVVYLAAEPGRNAIWFDQEGMCDTALGHLKDIGCRRVGVFMGPGLPSFLARAADAHHLKPVWVQCPEDVEAEQGAYNAFCRLWAESTHPDGLFVTDDMICRGVLRAVLHLGIDLPGELRLITHANRGVAIPYHKAVTRVEFDPGAQVKMATDLMVELLAAPDATPRFVSIPGVLVKGETT